VDASDSNNPTANWITVKGLVLPTPLELSGDRAAALAQLRRLLEDADLDPETRSYIESFVRAASSPPE
jgi:hypothetical protein